MQLAAFTTDHFPLGHAAMQVNEGLPAYIVSALERRYGGLQGKTVGILGMAFKADRDDTRASLSYKLRKLLSWAGARVLATDPYVERSPARVARVRRSSETDVLVLGAPHKTLSRPRTSAARTSSTSGARSAGASSSVRDPRHRRRRVHRRLPRRGAARGRATTVVGLDNFSRSTAPVAKSYDDHPALPIRRGRRQGRGTHARARGGLRPLRRRARR